MTIIFDGTPYSGSQEHRIHLIEHRDYTLAGEYSEAVGYAEFAQFESPDDAFIKQGTTYNIAVDAACNHEGNTIGASVRFIRPGEYIIIYKVTVQGHVYDTSMSVTFEGECTSLLSDFKKGK